MIYGESPEGGRILPAANLLSVRKFGHRTILELSDFTYQLKKPYTAASPPFRIIVQHRKERPI